MALNRPKQAGRVYHQRAALVKVIRVGDLRTDAPFLPMERTPRPFDALCATEPQGKNVPVTSTRSLRKGGGGIVVRFLANKVHGQGEYAVTL